MKGEGDFAILLHDADIRRMAIFLGVATQWVEDLEPHRVIAATEGVDGSRGRTERRAGACADDRAVYVADQYLSPDLPYRSTVPM